ncbi:MAG TPA: lysylphosphatidylglycerol synthase domain-containing protein [Gemmatimonadales bacterium]|nr:lysylphosphatidylglycerol synthase domain-containing protein [Gemmatimonadales bacterium]
MKPGHVRRWARWLEERPLALSCLALSIVALASLVMAGVAGFNAVGEAVGHGHPGWLALLIGARLAAYAGYGGAHRATLSRQRGPQIPADRSFEVVAFGAGTTSLGGGFATDRRAMRGAGASPRQATVRVLGLGALEWATLAPAAWISALTLLGSHDTNQTVSLPWALGVPLGCAGAVLVTWWLSARGRGKGPIWRALGMIVEVLERLREQLTHPLRNWVAWLGMTFYWAAEIVSLWAALRLFGLHCSAAVVVLGYATGHVLTPRSVPLAGVGVTEVLLSLALVSLGLRLAPALVAVLAYRTALLTLSIPPALLARERVHQLIGLRRATAP